MTQEKIQLHIYLDGNLQKIKFIFFIIIVINTLITILFFFLNWTQMIINSILNKVENLLFIK